MLFALAVLVIVGDVIAARRGVHQEDFWIEYDKVKRALIHPR